ncbi:MAG: N-acetylmuramoyl-L-alanine amidase [Verrucomicrobiota bacterium]
MPKLWKAFSLFVLLLLGAGCPSNPKTPPRLTLLHERETNGAVHPTNLALNSSPSTPANNATNLSGNGSLPSIGKAHSPRVLKPVILPAQEWISLGDWAKTNGWPAPNRIRGGAEPVYSLTTDLGTFAITIGQRMATFDGFAFGLGFGPRLVDGQPCIHGLDARKNFHPLLTLPSLQYPENPILVIDAGHGGENTGAKSSLADRYEKEFTLDWALRLRPMLEREGWRVFLTRTNDIDLSLSERIAFADQVQAHLFLSLHFNAVDSESGAAEYSGLETYCLTPAGMASNLTREFEDDPARSFPNNVFDAENLQYSFRLHRALVELTGRKDRGVRRARFMGVLRGQNRPAVLLEGGFLSNPAEARLISSGEYRQKLAEAVARALTL